MRASLSCGVLAVLTLTACESSSGAPEAPLLLEVHPALATSQQETDLEMVGRHFRPRVETDFTGRGGTLDASFRARLVSVDDGTEVELSDVRFESSELLTGRVPAGLPHGAYDVLVTDPAGTELRRGGGFRVVTSAESVAAFRFSPATVQRVGVPFLVSLTAVDAEGQTVDGFTGTVRVSDGTGSVTPRASGPFHLGRASMLLTVGAPLDGNRLRVEDDLGHVSESEPFDVRRGPPERVAWTGGALTAVAGTCAGPVGLEAQDALGAPADVTEPLQVAVSADPPDGFDVFSDAACATPVPGGALALSGEPAALFFIARRAGPLALHARPETLPGATQPHTVLPAAPAALRFTSPAKTLHPGDCSDALTLQVQDGFGNPTGPGSALGVGLSSPGTSGVTFYTDAGCSLSTGELSVAAGEPGASFHVRVSRAGRWEVGAAARAPSSLGNTSQEVLVEP